MQHDAAGTTATFASVKFKKQLIIFIGVLLMLAGCSQFPAPAVDAPTQPTSIPTQPIIVEVYDEVVVEDSMVGDELGVVVDENNRVLGVEIGSAAEQAGIQVGDLLETLEGIPFREKDKVKEKIREPKEDKKLKLKLKRNDQEMTLEVTPGPRQPRTDTVTPTPVFGPQDYF